MTLVSTFISIEITPTETNKEISESNWTIDIQSVTHPTPEEQMVFSEAYRTFSKILYAINKSLKMQKLKQFLRASLSDHSGINLENSQNNG